jgi:hypothetical protein
MNKPHILYSVSECKTKASILLKNLRSNDRDKASLAAKRFLRLPEFNAYDIEQMLTADVKRKQALAVIAFEKGFASWSELKSQLPLIRGGFLNLWFATYEEAKAYQQEKGGYLFAFKKQCFIVDADYISQLGFDPEDPDWQHIQFDWVKPKDKCAWQRLYRQWMLLIKNR